MVIAGAVLAGGGGARLGGADKALLGLGPRGETALDLLLARLRPQAGPLCISANGAPERFARYGLPVLRDEAPGAGPMAGVAACLAWAGAAGADMLLTVPVDTPFIPADLAARLLPGPSVAEAGGRTHYLCALHSVMSQPVLVSWLAAGHTRVRDFLALTRARPVAFPDAQAFLNINTPDDLAEARRLLRGPALPSALP